MPSIEIYMYVDVYYYYSIIHWIFHVINDPVWTIWELRKWTTVARDDRIINLNVLA